MSTKESCFTIDPSGSLSSTDEKLRQWLAHRAGSWRLVPSPRELIVLEPCDAPDHDAKAERVRITGTISSHGELTDVLNMIYSGRWEGMLTVLAQGQRKTLLIKGGDVVGAASTAESDRLGELLCSYGVISRKQMNEALQEAVKPERLGTVLMARQYITAHQLYSYLKKQVEAIFHGLLLLNQGTYYFYQRDLSDPVYRQLRLPMDSLLLEGVQRLDEMRYFREKIPSSEVVFETGELRASISLNEMDFVFLKLVDGRRDLAEIARLAQVSEYDATKMAYRLLQFGVIRPRPEDLLGRPGQVARNGGVGEVIDLVNGVLERLSEESARVDRERELRQAPRAFHAAAALYSPLFDGVALGDRGTLDRAVLERNLGFVEPAERVDFLYQGLSEFLSFTIFMVVEGLDQDQERRIRGVIEDPAGGAPPRDGP